MRKVVLYGILMLLLSCRISNQSMTGNYLGKGRDYEYSLSLNSDSTFSLMLRHLDVSSRCNGRWQYIRNDSILLRCYEEKDAAQLLSSGYMYDRVRTITLVNRNRIKMEGVVLIKKSIMDN